VSRLVSRFEFDRCHHAKRGVPTLAVVEDLVVLEERGGELDSRLAWLALEELDLEAQRTRANRLDHAAPPKTAASNTTQVTERRERVRVPVALLTPHVRPAWSFRGRPIDDPTEDRVAVTQTLDLVEVCI
jgi:hypothetical protein